MITREQTKQRILLQLDLYNKQDYGEFTDAFLDAIERAGIALPEQGAGEANLENKADAKPRELTDSEKVIAAKYERIAGRGMHELRNDELPEYLLWLADNYADGPHTEGHYGQARSSLEQAIQFVVDELERKTNDERILAVQLSDLRRPPAAQGAGEIEPVAWAIFDGDRIKVLVRSQKRADSWLASYPGTYVEPLFRRPPASEKDSDK